MNLINKLGNPIFVFFGILLVVLIGFIISAIVKGIFSRQLRLLIEEIQKSLGINGWQYLDVDDSVELKSARSVENYQPIQYFKDNRDKVTEASYVLTRKLEYAGKLTQFLKENEYINRPMYKKVEAIIRENLDHCQTYDVRVSYISPAGRSTRQKMIQFDRQSIDQLIEDPSILMSKTELNQYIKGENKKHLEEKQHFYYEKVNSVIDYANKYRDTLIVKGDRDELDKKIALLFDRTVNSIKKIKDINSEEWTVTKKYIDNIYTDIQTIVQRSIRILEYYNSSEFALIKTTCDKLMNSQREFNEYIEEKAKAISTLFGTRITRNETIIADEYNYIRPYKKSITPFVAEVSAQVFSSAENSPLEYVVKYFYPNKTLYPVQIQKLQYLIEELETLREARDIIDNYKKDYQQYITNVPDYVIMDDEDGFYSRLGFANVSEDVLTIEYVFSYTSGGGLTQRSFTVPMTEETIIELIRILQSKLTMTAFAREQRTLMTSKLRHQIKERDHFSCRICGNSIHQEPNLLLEIDHIIPISKGGITEPDNLQTLCWKCNRRKSNKIA